jgi:hypothetical protein
MTKLVALAAVAAGAGVLAYSMPELKRYMKIRRM